MKKTKKVKPFIVAHMMNHALLVRKGKKGNAYATTVEHRLGKIPVDLSGPVPELPQIVKVGRHYFTLTETNPLRYDFKTFAKGEYCG